MLSKIFYSSNAKVFHKNEILQGSVAKKPYNPIIGETFHCSWRVPTKSRKSDTNLRNSGTSVDGDSSNDINGTTEEPPGYTQLVYCGEQVSHHPPGKMAVPSMLE